jgi:hypothetical protein
MRFDRLLNVARALDESPNPRDFTMNVYTHDCGTAACALGHYAARADLQDAFRLVPDMELVTADGNEIGHWDFEVLDHFEINGLQAEELFAPSGCAGATTPAAAAAYIRGFVKRHGGENAMVMNSADPNPLLGTWKLKSYVVTRPGGHPVLPYGERPSGYLSYAPDGRMHVIGVASDRVPASGAAPLGQERAALYDTLFAYAGSYSVQPGKVVHHVDISWNEAWTGTDQARLFEVSGDILTLSTHSTDSETGSVTRYVVVWERVTAHD